MASYHVLTGSPDGNSFTVVSHIAVPGTGTNRAGVQWRVALVNSKIGGTTTLPDGDGTGGTISAAEKAQVSNGSLFEVVREIATSPGETAAQLRDRLDAAYPELAAKTQAELTARLTYFGFIRDVI